MDAGEWRDDLRGTPQGSVISPILANVYLHYVLDLWFQKKWRSHEVKGDTIIVRYADDFVVGFQHKRDAERFLDAVKERFGSFELELHPDKTRLIEFGQFALRACAVEVLMLGDWRAAAGGVGFWPECGHLARPTLGWKSQTGRPERKRFAFHIIRGRWALRAPEQVRWQASTCLSTWPPSPSA